MVAPPAFAQELFFALSFGNTEVVVSDGAGGSTLDPVEAVVVVPVDVATAVVVVESDGITSSSVVPTVIPVWKIVWSCVMSAFR